MALLPLGVGSALGLKLEGEPVDLADVVLFGEEELFQLAVQAGELLAHLLSLALPLGELKAEVVGFRACGVGCGP